MRLIKAQVQNYRSVEDSGVFDIGDLTSLVGKNEAGKTAILSALRALRPSESQVFEIDETIDYPRRFSTRFDERHPDESLLAAADTERIIKKAEALFKLMPADVAEFDHFAPARWLLENPDVLDRDSKAVRDTLDRAEAVFNKFNSLLS